MGMEDISTGGVVALDVIFDTVMDGSVVGSTDGCDVDDTESV